MIVSACVITKVIKQGVRTFAANMTLHTKVCIVGNLPEVYTGMIVTFGLEYQGELNDKYQTYRCVQYEIKMSDRNIGILSKNNVNTEEYEKTLKLHEEMRGNGLTWKMVQVKGKEIYRRYPFEKADEMHKLLVNDPEDEARMSAISEEIIRRGRMKKEISYSLSEFLTLFDEAENGSAYPKLSVSRKIKTLARKEFGMEKANVLDAEMKEKEHFVTLNIRNRTLNDFDLMEETQIESYIDKLKNEKSQLAEEQLNVLRCLSDNRPCIVTGGAGVGKTSVIKAVLECYAQFYGTKGILLLAPTGKASRRLAEKTGFPAGTIHRALRKKPDDDFIMYTKNNQLPHRLIVVDESSMIDTALMYDLLCAVDITAKVIFVGDHNQLPPVGYGEPFFDFFEFLQVFSLTENHRQAEGTDILSEANAVLRGEKAHSGRGVLVSHIQKSEVGNILDSNNNKKVQFISPYNSFNDEINDYLRKHVDTAEEKMLSKDISKLSNYWKSFEVGDKVMTVKNRADYCNGDIGYVTRRTADGKVTVNIEGKKVCIESSDIRDLAYAYAITIHKMQGSEAEKVIVFIPEGDSLVSKNMLYTAMTRARKELEIYYYKE